MLRARSLRIRLLPAAATLATAFTVAAGPPAGSDDRPAGRGSESADQLVKVRLTADVSSVAPGQTFHLAVVFDIAPHWHIYWKNAGDSGAPTDVEIRGPEGFAVGETLFPRPERFNEDDLTTFGYQRQSVLFVPVTAPGVLDTGRVHFEADVFFLVCRTRCLLGGATRSLDLETSGSRNPAAGPDDELLTRFRARLPRKLDELPGATARLEGSDLVVTGPTRGHTRISFFPLSVPGVVLGRSDVRLLDGDRFRIEVPVELRPHNALEEAMVVSGVVTLGPGRDDPSFEFGIPVEPAPAGAPTPAQEPRP